jgi:hypothetical protein
MAKRLDTHNRFAAELDSAPSRLDDLSFEHQREKHRRHAAAWRNWAFAALVVVVAGIAAYIAR